MNSSAQGVTGCAMMRATARAAAADIAIGCAQRAHGRTVSGVSLSVASVISASVPSEPISRRVRS
jgi:hypothetical protein